MTALTMLVTYKAKPGMRQTYVQQLRSSGILKKIREENGCLSYDFYFSEEDENTLLLVEQWQGVQSPENPFRTASYERSHGC